jgi:restriction system protein
MSYSFSRQAMAAASPPLLAAIVVYLGLSQGLPWLASREPGIELLSVRLAQLAPLVAGCFAFLALFGLLRVAWQRVRNIDPAVLELRALSWSRFTFAVSEGLRKQGYSVTMRRSDTGNGVEMVATRRGEKMLVQCRHWRVRKVGVERVRELCGAITAEKAHRGLFVTCGEFTLEAMRFAKDLPLGLMDGQALLQMVHGEPDARRLEQILVGDGIGLTRRPSI